MVLALLAAVLVPTACVLWFASAAMRNERLAVRQRLTDVYQRQLDGVASRLGAHWSRLGEVLKEAERLSPAEAFEKVIESGFADGAVVYDANGDVTWPVPAESLRPAEEPPPPRAWEQAVRWEEEGNLALAAAAFALAAREANDLHWGGRAAQGQARCLVRAGDAHAARLALRRPCEANDLLAARDPDGRLIAPGAVLLFLSLLPPEQESVRKGLISRLAWFVGPDAPAMPGSQRVYLLRELRAAGLPFPFLDAEELSLRFAEAHSAPPAVAGFGPSGLPRQSRFASAGRRVVAVVSLERLRALLVETAPAPADTPGATVAFHPAGASPEQGSPPPFLRQPAAAERMPGWEISLYLNQPDPFEAAAERQNLIYTWTAVVSIGAVCVLAVAVAAYVGRQARVTRLKNDLIATVSHELKTPLASIRLLVDTLLEGRCTDAGQAKEYFALIARENQRLSRLIDNFLTFSRMERNKRAFDFGPVSPAEAAREAAGSLGERLTAPQCEFTLDAPAGLPAVRADRDALVTVLVNLLDNAWKYTPEPRRIALRASASGGAVRFQVSDNGAGISRRAQRRIFDRFYQADRTLSRKAGGCGLGLSIVRFIVEAHGGAIEVASQPGKGSTFTVVLPLQSATARNAQA